jgi:ABC-type bacteriocin/lantibiotic exporter with double-glycine peptidase domain
MKFQKDVYSCGVASIINALRCFCVKIPEKRVRAHSATKEEYGTSEHGIKNALERLGYLGRDLVCGNKDEACWGVGEAIEDGSPVVLLLDRRQHWAVCIGRIGDRFIVFDSTRTKQNKEEHGVHVYRATQLASRWRQADGTYYGIVVKKS